MFIWFAIGCLVLGSFVLGAMFGVEYQKHSVQRFWNANNQRLRDYREAADHGAEDR